MRESPRIRRLRSDRKALDQLQAESSIFRFEAIGEPADYYKLWFHGKGLWRPDGQANVITHERHEVHVRLGAAYPRMMPELGWKSPIFHPNISGSGVVCLGGYGTYWVPSLTLDELCGMLWDMIRYENYDETSPYNREAAQWIKSQNQFRMPLDARPLRDRLAGYVPQAVPAPSPKPAKTQADGRRESGGAWPAARLPPQRPSQASITAQSPARLPRAVPVAQPLRNDSADVIFLDETHIIVPTASATPAGNDDILFID